MIHQLFLECAGRITGATEGLVSPLQDGCNTGVTEGLVSNIIPTTYKMECLIWLNPYLSSPWAYIITTYVNVTGCNTYDTLGSELFHVNER